MSLRRRTPYYIAALFNTNPCGLTLHDIETGILDFEPSARTLNIQYDIADTMCFKRRPEEECTKHDKTYGTLWVFREGLYFPGKSAAVYANDENKFTCSNDESSLEEIRECDSMPLLARLLLENDGLALDRIRHELRCVFERLDDKQFEELFRLTMEFAHKDPYDTFYLDRKGETNHSYGHFTHWICIDGIYYHSKIEEAFEGKSSEEVRKITELLASRVTLTGQLRCYAQKNKLTNSEFLREHAFMSAMLDSR